MNLQTLETTLARLGIPEDQILSFAWEILRDQDAFRRHDAEEFAQYQRAVADRDARLAADALHGPLLSPGEGDARDPGAEREYRLQMGSWNRDR